MAVDPTTYYHPIIQTWLKATEQGRRDINEQKDRELRQKLEEDQIKSREELQKKMLEYRKSEAEHEAKRASFFDVLDRFSKQQIKPQGFFTNEPSGVTAKSYDSPTAMLGPPPQGQIGFSFEQPGFEQQQTPPQANWETKFNPYSEQGMNVPGVGYVSVPGDMIPTNEDLAKRVYATEFAKTQAEIPKTLAVAKGQMALQEARAAETRRRDVFLETGRNQRAEDANASREKIAGMRAAAATENALEKPIGLAGAPYGLDPKMKLKDVPNFVQRPLTPTEQSHVDFIKEMQGLARMALDSGDKTKWSQFHGFGGNFEQWIKSKTNPGSQSEMDMRWALPRLKAIEGHRLFGSAFTPNEQSIISQSLADFSMHPKTAKSNLEKINKIFNDAYLRAVGPRIFPGGTTGPRKVRGLDLDGNPIY